MPLELIDFVAETGGVELEDFPPEVQSRINDALGGLSSAEFYEPPSTTQDRIVTENPTTDGEHSSFAAAINAAREGDVVFVESGTYTEDVTVDKKNLTIRGIPAPSENDPAVLDGRLEITAPGVTVRSLKLAPSTEYDIDAGVDPSILLVSADDALVQGNLLEGMRADATGGNESGSLNGIHVWDASDSGIGGIVVRDNTVRDVVVDGDVDAGWPSYGGAAAIKVQGTVDGVEVLGNSVSDVYSAGWTWGIVLTHSRNAPDEPPEDVKVSGNTVEKLNTAGSQFDPLASPTAAPYPGNAFGIDGNDKIDVYAHADEATVTNNVFRNVPHGVKSKDPDQTLDVRDNYWGDSTGPSTGASVVDPVRDAETDEPADGAGTGLAVNGTTVSVRFDPWLSNEP